MLLKNGYQIKRLNHPVNGYYYQVENKEDLFAVVSKRRNGKVLHDIFLQFDQPLGDVEVTIVRPKPNEEEIIDYFYLEMN